MGKMKRGDAVRCIDAKEFGIPIAEGLTYTVKSTFVGAPGGTENPLPGMEKEPGVTLNEVPGYFLAKRFEKVAV